MAEPEMNLIFKRSLSENVLFGFSFNRLTESFRSLSNMINYEDATVVGQSSKK